MITAEQNELMTRVGPGTPGGKLLRSYWQPAALVEELGGERPVKAVRLLGEDLVLFRDEQGRYGLLDRHCAHRRADLSYGRREDGGLRCPFHGWLFDASGRCLETPAEPEASRLCESVRLKAYPVAERNGILWAYLGEGAPPAFPALDCFVAPDEYTFAFKGYWDCNWLQALEVGIDPAHASFLHRFAEDEDPGANYGRQFRAASASSSLPMTRVLREYFRPRLDHETTDYGFRIFALRGIDESHTHVRVTNLIFPETFVIPLSPEMTISQWHVPVDDYGCYWYAIFTAFDKPVDKAEMRRQRVAMYAPPDYKPRSNRANRYGFDAEEQRRQTYTGMGFDINVHDQWACESQGRIHDRTREYLGSSDRVIVAYRRVLLKAIEQAGQGQRPLMSLDAAEAARIRGPVTIDGMGPAGDWQGYWRDYDRARRKRSAWAAALPDPLAPAVVA
jgi:phenylpropionate dioxygenase-like ring-hydroxylating dioxygenase large terminal subunit